MIHKKIDDVSFNLSDKRPVPLEGVVTSRVNAYVPLCWGEMGELEDPIKNMWQELKYKDLEGSFCKRKDFVLNRDRTHLVWLRKLSSERTCRRFFEDDLFCPLFEKFSKSLEINYHRKRCFELIAQNFPQYGDVELWGENIFYLFGHKRDSITLRYSFIPEKEISPELYESLR